MLSRTTTSPLLRRLACLCAGAGLLGAALATAAVFAGPKPALSVSRTVHERVAGVAAGHCTASLSRVLLDPQNGNRAVRVLTLSATVEHDQLAGYPRRISGMWLVDAQGNASQQCGPVILYRDDTTEPAEGELLRFWVTCAPAEGLDWGRVEDASQLDVRLHGSVRR
jgi:hypothetical protein